jgi:hypothetical protein
MYLGLSIENSVINAAILNDGGDFVWQDSHSLGHDKMANLLEIWLFWLQMRPKRIPTCPNPLRLAHKAALSASQARLMA